MKRTRSTAWLAMVACLVTAAPATSEAQETDTEKVELLYAEGAALYRDGKYRAAIDRFEAAYALYPEPNLLYNIARSYEALGELEPAIDNYRRVASAPNADPAVRGKAERKAKMLAEARERSASVKVEPRAEPNARLTPSRVRAERSSGSSGMTIAKWSATAVAGGLLVGGAIAFGLGASDHGTVNDARTSATDGVASLTLSEAEGLVDDGSRKKTIGAALLGSGAAVGAAAVALFILDAGDDEPAVDVQVSGDGAAFLLTGSF